MTQHRKHAYVPPPGFSVHEHDSASRAADSIVSALSLPPLKEEYSDMRTTNHVATDPTKADGRVETTYDSSKPRQS
jgi:hypothetical protein